MNQVNVLLIKIEKSIHTLRAHRVMFDADLAKLYGVPTNRLNEAVKRNRARFPADFMFSVTMNELSGLRSQFATSKGRGGRRTMPHAFTEQGVAMLSSVLNSDRAIAVNIEIMRAFVKVRQAMTFSTELARRLALVEAKLDQLRAESGQITTETKATLAEHDKHIRIVFEAIQRLMAEENEKQPPARIGFKLP